MGTISKALELLNLFSDDRAEIGLGEMARLAGRDKATVHRYLTELEANGFVEQNPVSRTYRLGPALLRLAALRESCFPISKLLQALVNDLAELVGELVHISLLQGESLSPLVHFDPQVHGTQVHYDPSEVLPLHATSSGLAVLAFLPDKKRDKVLSRPLAIFTSKTPTNPEILRSFLAEINLAGVCIVDGTFDDEVASIGAPLFGEGGHVVGAMAIAAPRGRAQLERLEAFSPKLAEAARAACHTLGGQFPEFSDGMSGVHGISILDIVDAR